MLEDRRDNKDPKMVEEDIVTVYGVHNGAETMDRVIGGSDEIPSIDVVYVIIENK